ncbi:hypothetical protein [Flavobacterium sp. HSC-61S13]|uniref:DUF6913 domain-containing protein n=1 Tax=Flavobacterium sp. HSC-61S13 TaxID=2910963 RepID=UPI00209DE82F|nr:hypothetical protein [Flavobacterium sp. HSC-61S13]
MFLNIIKYKALKRSVKNQLSRGQHIDFNGVIKQVGIILNQKDFANKEAVVKELGLRGIGSDQISFLLSRSVVGALKDGEVAIKVGDFDWEGKLKNEKVQRFIDTPFDLLISYYDVDEMLLLWSTAHSQARFKVGFSTIKLSNNHLSLQLPIEQYKTYIEELFRYIEIFKK